MTDHAAVVQGMAAGTGGAILALLGVDAPTLTAALIGAVLGATFAPTTGRARAILLFLAAVCAAAEASSVLAPLVVAWLPAIPMHAASKGCAILVGVLLHPVIQALSVAAPGVIRAAADRISGGRTS